MTWGVREGKWNPRGKALKSELEGNIPLVGGALASQVVDEYLELSPTYLDGSLAGDNGFDPFCLTALAKPNGELLQQCATPEARLQRMLAMSPAEQQAAVAWMRNAELKHARLAMLAAAGWPLSELTSGAFLRTVVGTNGRAPSLFNGGLFDFPFLPAVVVVFGGLAFLEFTTKDSVKDGNYGFDPAGFSTMSPPQLPDGVPEPAAKAVANLGDLNALKLSELKHGRAAMMAITGFAVQEFIWGNPVVEQTPFFFGR